MPPIQVNALSAQQLAATSTPASGSDLEALPWAFHDTDSADFANAATNLNVGFFQVVKNDKTQGNIEQAGTLPSPNWFELYGFCCDILAVPSTAVTVAGALSDIANILKTALAAFQFTLSNKNYGIFPLTLAHATGGETGFLASAIATPGTVQYGNNNMPDGGWWYDAAIVIPTQQNFVMSILTKNGQALTLTQTPLPVRAVMWGVYHRRVL